MMRLHSAARSSASFRVRIALNLKGLPYEYAPVDLVHGAQFGEAFRGLNPAELVPVLEHDGAVLTQSLAIIEYLDERYPQPPLLPQAPLLRAYVRAMALAIACEIHPLNNLRVLRYLTKNLGQDEEAKNAWYRHWVEQGPRADGAARLRRLHAAAGVRRGAAEPPAGHAAGLSGSRPRPPAPQPAGSAGAARARSIAANSATAAP